MAFIFGLSKQDLREQLESLQAHNYFLADYRLLHRIVNE